MCVCTAYGHSYGHSYGHTHRLISQCRTKCVALVFGCIQWIYYPTRSCVSGFSLDEESRLWAYRVCVTDKGQSSQQVTSGQTAVQVRHTFTTSTAYTTHLYKCIHWPISLDIHWNNFILFSGVFYLIDRLLQCTQYEVHTIHRRPGE